MLYTVTGKPGRLLHMMIYKPGNLPAVGTGTESSRSRVIGCAVLTDSGLFAVSFYPLMR